MRRIAALSFIAVFLATSLAAAASVQEGQEAVKEAEGTIKAVNLETSEVVIETAEGQELSVTLTEETEVKDANGPVAKENLEGKTGSEVMVSYVEMGEKLVAQTIELVA